MEYVIIILCLILFVFDCKYAAIYLRLYKKQIKAFSIKIIHFLKDWRNALSFGIAWLITNGWGWAFMFLGRFLHIRWMKYAGDAYIAFLWLPFVNEKVVTVALAAIIKRCLFRRKMNSQLINPESESQSRKLALNEGEDYGNQKG